MNKKNKIALINHGCAKNLVDSELMLGLLTQRGFEITLDETKADVVIINTCSFIHDAEKESVQSILQMIEEGKKIIITGCLPQKHKKELKKAIPEASALLGTSDIEKIAEVVKKVIENKTDYTYEVSENPVYKYLENVDRQQITVGSSSYVKIADGCNYKCGSGIFSGAGHLPFFHCRSCPSNRQNKGSGSYRCRLWRRDPAASPPQSVPASGRSPRKPGNTSIRCGMQGAWIVYFF